MNEKDRYQGIIVSHTHWDREWYLSFEEFRRWLVMLIDDILDNLPKKPKFKSFMLDGQTVLIEDYLEIRPERKEELHELIQQGRIAIGPFYVLADEFLESGEGMIRNLLLGHKIAEQMGVEPMKVGYVPDTFGHVWQLPQILRGFDVKYMYYFRGYPPLFGNWEEYEGKNDQTPLEHFYESPDGTRVLAFHHILGYANASAMCGNFNPDALFPYMNALYKLKTTLKKAVPRTIASLILLMNGDDHVTAEWAIPDLIDRWNDKSNTKLLEKYPVIFEHGTLTGYFEGLEERVRDGLKLPVISGEARGSAYTQVTPATISTRMNLKLLNWRCFRELEKYAEPFSALSSLLGARAQGAYLEKAWKWLIKNHPHDSICGCSIDRVHEDMIVRFNWCLDLASDVYNHLCAAVLTGLDRDSLLKSVKEKLGNTVSENDVQILGLFNPNPFIGSFVVEGHVSVNPHHSYKLFELDGSEIKAFHVHYLKDYRTCGKDGQNLYKKFQTNWSVGKITALIDNAPACGYTMFYLIGTSDAPEFEEPKLWIPEPIHSEFFTVSFNSNGSINVLDRDTNHLYRNLNLFEDVADDGDEYDHGPLPGDLPIYTNNIGAKFIKSTENDVFTEIRTAIEFRIPVDLIEEKGKIKERSNQVISMDIDSTVKIYKHLPRIDVKMSVQNTARSHRLRVIFPSNIEAKYSHADDHFTVMRRTVALPRDDGWFQDAQGTYHVDTFVDLNDGQRGLAIFLKGLCEFEIIKTPEALDQQGHVIALTLFRAVGWLSKYGHLGRKSGLNGPNLQTPGAQLMNHQFEFEYAIFPHEGTWQQGNVYSAACAYNAPPRWFSERHFLRNETLTSRIPLELSFVRITNPQVILSALKQSERIKGAKDGMIIRIFNPTEVTQETDFIFGIPIKEIALTNLLEQDQKLLTLNDPNKITIAIEPYKIITYRVKI